MAWIINGWDIDELFDLQSDSVDGPLPEGAYKDAEDMLHGPDGRLLPDGYYTYGGVGGMLYEGNFLKAMELMEIDTERRKAQASKD